MKRAFIGVGSNMGDRAGNCLEAFRRLGRLPETVLAGHSELYLTQPQGKEDQEWFVNGVALLETGLTAGELLDRLMDVEQAMGRVRNERWGPRVVDLDILLYGNGVIREPGLTVPHPRMHERRFVLVPMVQMAPDLAHPVLGLSMRELLGQLPDEGQRVSLLKE